MTKARKGKPPERSDVALDLDRLYIRHQFRKISPPISEAKLHGATLRLNRLLGKLGRVSLLPPGFLDFRPLPSPARFRVPPRQDLRSCIHIARRAAHGKGEPLVPGSTATVGIRVMPSGQLLDCSPEFKQPSRCGPRCPSADHRPRLLAANRPASALRRCLVLAGVA